MGNNIFNYKVVSTHTKQTYTFNNAFCMVKDNMIYLLSCDSKDDGYILGAFSLLTYSVYQID